MKLAPIAHSVLLKACTKLIIESTQGTAGAVKSKLFALGSELKKDGEDVTDRSERFFVNEIIRNNILKLYSDEIPYSSEVHTLSFKEDTKIIRMSCEIIVERDSQKRIVVGSKGAGIKQLGIQSRKELEAFFGKQIFIELFVKVRDNWRNNANMLKQFGYEGDWL